MIKRLKNWLRPKAPTVGDALMDGVDLDRDEVFERECMGETLSAPGGCYGWSITVGDLRRALDGVPDDYEVMLENAEVDDCEISNVNINHLYRPYADAPGLLVLGGGQIITSEYGYHERLDLTHDGRNRYASMGHWKNPDGWYIAP